MIDRNENLFSNNFFYSANDFFKKVFGRKVYKIAIDAGCSCPNRDGSKGTGGCIFCSQSGSGDFAQRRDLTVREQIESGKSLVKAKTKDNLFVAYFQNFTNTYGDSEILYSKYLEAARTDGILGVSIATRPDSISDEMIAKLKELCKKTFVILELGFQTSNEKTALYINRFYENKIYDDCVRTLRTNCPDMHIITHVIFGLPGETEKDMLETVNHVVRSGVHGIKISLLHVLKGTALADDYLAGKIKCMDMQEYFEVLGKALTSIPSEIVIHRLTGDGDKKILIAPLWTGNKKNVLNSMMKYFEANEIRQGKLFEDRCSFNKK